MSLLILTQMTTVCLMPWLHVK